MKINLQSTKAYSVLITNRLMLFFILVTITLTPLFSQAQQINHNCPSDSPPPQIVYTQDAIIYKIENIKFSSNEMEDEIKHLGNSIGIVKTKIENLPIIQFKIKKHFSSKEISKVVQQGKKYSQSKYLIFKKICNSSSKDSFNQLIKGELYLLIPSNKLIIKIIFIGVLLLNVLAIEKKALYLTLLSLIYFSVLGISYRNRPPPILVN